VIVDRNYTIGLTLHTSKTTTDTDGE
jgi:hypothetical protein